MSLSKRDLEDLKPAVDETLRHVLGFSDSAVVTAALNCVAKGMSKSKAIGKHKTFKICKIDNDQHRIRNKNKSYCILCGGVVVLKAFM